LEREGYVFLGKTTDQLLAEWLGIDRVVLEQEKRAMLDALRADVPDTGKEVAA
jgi:hypothetical protein